MAKVAREMVEKDELINPKILVVNAAAELTTFITLYFDALIGLEGEGIKEKRRLHELRTETT